MPSKRCTWPPGACMALPSTCPNAARGSPTAEPLPGWSTRFIGRRSSSTAAWTRTRSFSWATHSARPPSPPRWGKAPPRVGGVLLDPAGIGRELPQLLRRITVPVMVIGADEDIWPTRNRGQFYRFIPGAVGEISIRDTLHQDAQYPNEHTLRAFEDEPDDTEEAQIAFVSALTASAFGLAATGSIDYGWNSFENGHQERHVFQREEKIIVMRSVKSSVKGWKTAAARLTVSDRHRRAGAWSASCLATGTR